MRRQWEAADVFHRNFTEIAQRVVEFRQRSFVGRGELLEEQRRRTAPRPLDDHGEDTVRVQIEPRPGERQTPPCAIRPGAGQRVRAPSSRSRSSQSPVVQPHAPRPEERC